MLFMEHVDCTLDKSPDLKMILHAKNTICFQTVFKVYFLFLNGNSSERLVSSREGPPFGKNVGEVGKIIRQDQIIILKLKYILNLNFEEVFRVGNFLL